MRGCGSGMGMPLLPWSALMLDSGGATDQYDKGLYRCLAI